MFKKLRNKIAEEALRLPAQVDDITESSEVGCSQVQQQYTSFGNNNSKTNSDVPSQTTSTISEDLIDLNNSVASPILQAEKDQFSIIDEDDSNASDPSSPQKSQEDTSAGSEAIYSSRPTMNVEHPEPKYPYSSDVENPAASKQNYVPQSDTESEMEEVQSLNLEGITKEDLVFVLQRLRKRTQKYKGFYAEAVKAYKELHAEKEKLEHAVSETQDKTLRRMAELREQCNLEQQAKAHLEQNLRMVLEEKEQMIHVLETKVRLLKEGNIVETVEDERQDSSPVPLLDAEEKKTNDQDANENIGSETAALKDRIKRQELLLAKCKDTLKSNKERTTQLMEEKNSFEEQLEQKKKEFLDLQVQEAEIQASLRADLQQMREKLIQLEKQQEENAMSMAETKRNMHEELELREQQLSKLKVELQNLQQEKQVVDDKVGEQEEKLTVFQKEHESEISKLQTQLELTEKNMEEERQNLMQELSRGKAAALSLLKEEHAKKLTAVEEEWKAKMNELQEEHQKALLEKEKENSKDLQLQAEDFKKCLLEKTEEMNLAIEEQSLQKTAALSELDIQKDELQRNIEELTTRKMELESQMSNLEEQFKRQREHHQKEIEELTDVHNAQMSGKINEIENLKIDFQKNLGIQKETLEKNYQVCLQETIDKHSDKEQERNIELESIYEAKVLELTTHYENAVKQKEANIESLNSTNKKLGEDLEENLEIKYKYASVCKELEETISTKDDELQELKRDHEKELNNLKNNLEETENEKNRQYSLLENKLKEINNIQIELEKSKDLCEKLETEKFALSENNSVLQDEIVHHLKLVESSKLESEKYLETVKDLENQLQVQKDEYQSIRNKLANLEGEVEQYKFNSTFSTHSLEKLTETNQELTEKLCLTKEKEELLTHEISTLQSEKKKLSKELHTVKKCFETDEDALKILRKENNELLANIHKLETNTQQLMSEKKDLESCVSSLKDLAEENSQITDKLKEVEEEKQNISMVLESMEKEMAEKTAECENRLRFAEEELSKRLEEVSNEQENDIDSVRNMYNIKIVELEKTIEDLQYREKELNDLLEKTRKEYEKRIMDMNEKLSVEILSMSEQTDHFKEELDFLRLQLKDSQKEYDEKIAKLSKINVDKIEELNKELEKAQKEIIEVEEKTVQLETTLKEKEETLSNQLSDKTILEKTYEEEKEKWKEWNEEVKELHETKLEELKDSLKVTLEMLKSEVEELKNKLSEEKLQHEQEKAKITENHVEEIKRMEEMLQNEKESWCVKESVTNTEMLNLQTKLKEISEQLGDVEKATLNANNQIILLTEEKENAINSVIKSWENKHQEAVNYYKDFINNLKNDNENLQTILKQKVSELNVLEVKNETQRKNNEEILNQVKEFDRLTQQVEILNEECVLLKQEKLNCEGKILELEKNLNSEKNVYELVTELQNKLELSNKQMQNNQSILSKTENQYKDKISNIKQKFVTKLKNMQQEFKKKIQQLENNLEKEISEKLEITKKLNIKQLEIDELKNFCDEHEPECNKIKVLLEEKTKLVDLKYSESEELLNKLAVQENENDLLKQQIITLKEKMEFDDSCKNTIQILSENAKDYEMQIKLQNDKSAKYKEQLEILQSENNIKNNKILELETELCQLLENDKGAQNCIDELLSKVELSETSQNTMIKELCTEREKIKKLSEELQTQTNLIDSLAEKCKVYELEQAKVKQEFLNLTDKHEKEVENLQKGINEEHQIKLSELKKKAEMKLVQIKRQLQNDKEQSLKLLEESLSDSYKQELVNMEHRIRCAEDEKMKIISESEEKINELQNKLISVQEELKESSNLSESKIKELESEKENLNIQLLKIKEDKETEIAELKNKFKCEFDDAAKERNETIANMEAEHKLIVNQLQEEIKVLSAQLDESLLVAEVNQSAVSQKVNDYKYQLTELQTAFETLQKEKTGGESELKQKLEVLQFENNKLLNDNLVLENLKKEKELLNNRLKEMEDKYNESSKKDEWFLVLQEENEKLKTDCTTFNNSNEEKEELKIKICELEKEKQEIKDILKEELGKLKTEKQDLTEQLYKERLRTELLNQQNVQKEPDDKDISLLKMENKMLKEQLEVFETQTFGVNHVQNYQKQLLAIQSSYEEKLRDKDMELTSKLKQMVRDFHSQMEQKESECDKTLSCFIEKGQEQEGKMEREHRKELAALHQELFEKNCAMDDLTEHFQQLLHEKENELKDYKQKLKDANLLQVKKERTEDQASQESHRAEVNDWEDGWEDAEDISPVQQQTAEKESQDDLLCTEHLERITSLQTAVTNAQEEITELRFLLGLTSKSSSSSSSNHVDDNSLKVPEPTEFEYLRNILYEYMMGKEPMILAKVITAVLKFSKDQTQQILQREAARQIQDSALK